VELSGEFADLEMGFIFRKTSQDVTGTDNGIDQISVLQVRGHFIIKTVYLILKQAELVSLLKRII